MSMNEVCLDGAVTVTKATMDVSTNSIQSFLSVSDDDLGGSGISRNNHRGMKKKRRGSLNKSDVFANSQMTSLRITRRSSIKTPEDLIPPTILKSCTSNDKSSSDLKRLKNGLSRESSRNEAMRSTSSDECLEGSATTLIMEEIRRESMSIHNFNDETQTSTSPKGETPKDSKSQLNSEDSWISNCSWNVGVNGPFEVLEEEQESHESEDVHNYWRLKVYRGFAIVRVRCGNFVNSSIVQVIMTIILVANAIILGALTFELPALTRRILDLTDLCMLGMFTVEIVLHGVYLGLRKLFHDSWLAFDAIVITLSWCFLESSLAVLRSFRIFRVFSIVSRWESLRTLFEAIGSTIPRMASIWLSLLLFFYVFCVLFTNVWSGLYADGYLDHDYFGNLGQTFVTLFQVMTLDSWADVARQVMVYEPWAFFGFLAFILFTAFFIVNLIVAVICESLIQMSRAPATKGDDGIPSARLEVNHPDGQLEKVSLEDLLRQVLKNQAEMKVAIRELQEEIMCITSRQQMHTGLTNAALRELREEVDMLNPRERENRIHQAVPVNCSEILSDSIEHEERLEYSYMGDLAKVQYERKSSFHNPTKLDSTSMIVEYETSLKDSLGRGF